MLVVSAAASTGCYAYRALGESDTEPIESPLVLSVARQLIAGPREFRAERGPNPTAIVRLAAERASLCWLIVHRYENAYANSSGWSIAQADETGRATLDDVFFRGDVAEIGLSCGDFLANSTL
jgi:hypothetical protein